MPLKEQSLTKVRKREPLKITVLDIKKGRILNILSEPKIH